MPPENRFVDGFGRVVRKLRISVTDLCNLRCTYCMPPEGLNWLPKEEILSYEEFRRLAGIFVDHGVRHIRITGGEPTVRKDLAELVSRLGELRDRGLETLNMTTNGLFLKRDAQRLKDAGLDGINLSLDTLNRERFESMTRRDALRETLEGLAIATTTWPGHVKVNAVLIPGINDDEAIALATTCGQLGAKLRFIERMPLDAQGAWSRDKVVTGKTLQQQLGAVRPLAPAPSKRGASPAETLLWGQQPVGFINSVTEPFCQSCDRVRLTADGGLRNCLFSTWETNLKTPLRSGATDRELVELIQDNIDRKWAGHAIGSEDFVPASRPMSQLGG